MTWEMKWVMTCRVVMVAAGAPPHFQEPQGADMAEAMDDLLRQELPVDLVLAEVMDDLLHPEHQVARELAEAMDDLPLQEPQADPAAATDGLLPQELLVVPAPAEQLLKNDSKIILGQAIISNCDVQSQPNQDASRIAHG